TLHENIVLVLRDAVRTWRMHPQLLTFTQHTKAPAPGIADGRGSIQESIALQRTDRWATIRLLVRKSFRRFQDFTGCFARRPGTFVTAGFARGKHHAGKGQGNSNRA